MASSSLARSRHQCGGNIFQKYFSFWLKIRFCPLFVWQNLENRIAIPCRYDTDAAGRAQEGRRGMECFPSRSNNDFRLPGWRKSDKSSDPICEHTCKTYNKPTLYVTETHEWNHQSFSTRQTLKRLRDYPDVLTVEQVSELLGVCTKTVYSMIRRGELKKQNVGRLFRIPKSYVMEYLGIEPKR